MRAVHSHGEEAAVKRWISHPERYPHRCPWSHQAAPDDGPYLDTGLIYFAARDIDGRIEPDRRESWLYISPQALIEAADLPGSPIVVMPRGEWAAMSDDYVGLGGECENLKLDVERLEDELEAAYQRLAALTDPDAMAEAVAERLADTFARKTGPKPKAA